MATPARTHRQPQPYAGEPLIPFQGVEKVYRLGRVDYPALCRVHPTVTAGEMVAVVGPSGSGKTTILNIKLTAETTIAVRGDEGPLSPEPRESPQTATFWAEP